MQESCFVLLSGCQNLSLFELLGDTGDLPNIACEVSWQTGSKTCIYCLDIWISLSFLILSLASFSFGKNRTEPLSIQTN